MALELQSLSKTYGRQAALDAVSLRVEEGDCYGFLGHNGAGKTTAMRIVLGLQRPDSGRVLLDGFDARRHPREAHARMGGLIEQTGFHRGWNGRRNLVVLGRLQGLGRTEARQEADRVLDLVGLSYVGRKPVRAWSQGMRQRLGIGQALLGSPRYVLLDEPNNGLDPEGIADMRTLIRRLREESGVAVLLSSHQLSEVAELCNRVGVIKQGRLLVEGSVGELLAARKTLVRIDAEPREAARGILEAAGIRPGPLTAQGWLVEPGAVATGDLARRLVEGGCTLSALSPQPPSLEQVYLEADHDEDATPRSETPSGPTRPPAERLAPPRAVTRVLRYDLARWASPLKAGLLWSAPAAFGALGIYQRHAAHEGYLQEMKDGGLASTTVVTAFEGAGVGLQLGLPILAFVAAGFASQSIAGERAQGTLRNVFLRPTSRWQVGLGKIFSLIIGILFGYAVLSATSLIVAGSFFEFEGVYEILNGERYYYLEASALWPELRQLLLHPLLPLVAYGGLGFLLGSVVSRGTVGLALSMIAVAILDFLKIIARTQGWEHRLPSAYLPSPLGDRSSFVHYYADTVTGVGNASFAYHDTAFLVPLAWALVCFALGTFFLVRRPVS